MRTVCLLFIFGFTCGPQGKLKPMTIEEMLKSVSNDRIQFVTQRPRGSNFAVLERRAIVTGPPELVELANSGDVRVLNELTKLLKDPKRAWAAEVLLASMTRREEKLVDSFASHPEKWWQEVGQTALERWSSWLNSVDGKLVWDPKEKAFVEKP